MPEGLVCGWCRRQAPEAQRATWSSSSGPVGTVPLCPACTREHLRSIEARLDEQWWERPPP